MKLPGPRHLQRHRPLRLPEVAAHPRAGLRGAGEADRRARLPAEPDHPLAQRPRPAGQRQSRIPPAGQEGGRMGVRTTRPIRWPPGTTATSSCCSPSTRWRPATTRSCRACERLALEAANGQSIVGSWGHKFAGPDGRLVGYGMMNAPGVPLTISLVMARAAGVKDPAVRPRHRAQRQAAALLHRQGRGPLRRPRPVDRRPTRTTASAGWPPSCSTCSTNRKARSSSRA